MTTKEQHDNATTYRAELADAGWQLSRMPENAPDAATRVLRGRAMERDRLKLHTEQAEWEKRGLKDVAPNIEGLFTAAASFIELGMASPYSLYRIRAALKLAEMNGNPHLSHEALDYAAYALAYYGPDREDVPLEQLAKLMEDNEDGRP